ncbi:monovalent cation:proton antiporter-2 (CPA2) family protein [Candidatus Nitronereus thalassa]|uniref:Monovalent cation:proton antiporter-2 (CPA2) family protein n=1 Tax=Candidatus Nitronereus thalassa TaxID=3020898 RepID=A0ABU3K5W6_9BACT|nr:monovalent cation:proton antiporter-2 (CPA2) family protein [Candidatus Nitronereus thalassa]MDT7041750.1 monovalent cation:proton antiporter-2 (CPA2) family protein [Candidatus Nitronereus thalassa]
MNQEDLLLGIIIILAAAVVAIPLCKRLGLGVVIGYLAAGAAVGPWGLGVTSEVETLRHFAEFGVVFLLFLIGLEIHLDKLWQMRQAVLGLGTAQIVLTAGCLAGIGLYAGLPWPVALITGFGLAMSSTAFGLQILAERGETASPHGQAALAILLMQDLAVVPFLAAIPLLGGIPETAQDPLWFSGLKILGALALVLLVGRYVLRPALRIIASTRHTEAFSGAAILTVLGAAWLMEQVHLSMALGAFLTGLLLSDSEYRHQIEAAILPLREFLLGLFFMSVGMSVDFGFIHQQGSSLVLLVISVMIIKALVLLIICRVSGHTREDSIRVALLLPQCGEFCFVLFGLAVAKGVMTHELFQVLLILIAMTMFFTPILDLASSRLIHWFRQPSGTPMEKPPLSQDQHVIIAGFGRVGQTVAKMLHIQNVPYQAFDVNPAKVDIGRKQGYDVYFGDVSQAEVLQAAGAGHAKLVVLTVDDPRIAEKTVSAIRYLYPSLPIEARAHDLPHGHFLKQLGADRTVPETIEASLELGRSALIYGGIGEQTANSMLEDFRRDEYALLRKILLRNSELPPSPKIPQT